MIENFDQADFIVGHLNNFRFLMLILWKNSG